MSASSSSVSRSVTALPPVPALRGGRAPVGADSDAPLRTPSALPAMVTAVAEEAARGGREYAGTTPPEGCADAGGTRRGGLRGAS